MASTDAIRVFAADVGLNPSVNGATNVQDALDAAGQVTLAALADVAQADTPTTLPSDGATHDFGCVTATPPSWMDASGNITAPGLYCISCYMVIGDAPTTPGDFVSMSGAAGAATIPLDGINLADHIQPGLVISVTAADLPVSTTVNVTMPTDATATITATPTVNRLLASS